MRRDAVFVYEYFTKQYGLVKRITGWSQWNVTIYPEKKIFSNNHPPTQAMRDGLVNGDNVSMFILNDDGSITYQPMTEEEKTTLNEVLWVRFIKDYPFQRQLDILMGAVSDHAKAEYKEMVRRRGEIT